MWRVFIYHELGQEHITVVYFKYEIKQFIFLMLIIIALCPNWVRYCLIYAVQSWCLSDLGNNYIGYLVLESLEKLTSCSLQVNYHFIHFIKKRNEMIGKYESVQEG